jgi:hypothetical protein
MTATQSSRTLTSANYGCEAAVLEQALGDWRDRLDRRGHFNATIWDGERPRCAERHAKILAGMYARLCEQNAPY